MVEISRSLSYENPNDFNCKDVRRHNMKGKHAILRLEMMTIKKNQAEVPVNWCPALGTVLAIEEVIDGVSEWGGHPVIRKVVVYLCLSFTI